jgi:diguanylate cyclase (GGDEF)-like protein
VAEAAQVAQWRHTLVALHLGMVGVAGLMGLLAWRLHRMPPAARPAWTQACGAAAFVLALVFAALVVAVDQWVTPNITPFFMASVLVGVTLLQRPLTAAVLFAVAYAVYFWALGQTQGDAMLLLSNRANGFSAAVLAWALATLTWRKTARNLLLTRQLAQRQAQMHSQQLELRRLATSDGLTGLVNRVEFERLGRLEVERARRYGLALGLLLIDLDHFKRVNDQWGHPAGDAVLVAVAAVLRAHVRVSDVVARMGGEEFMVLLPHTQREAALGLAEKLRQCVAATQVQSGSHTISVTASVGLAAASGNSVDFTTLYQHADHALYSAKAAGRNVVRAE